MKVSALRSWLAGDKIFLVLRFVRVISGFAFGYLLQFYLIRRYPASVNAWLQISLRTIDIGPILATGFGVISLSSGMKASHFISYHKREYLASLAVKLSFFLLVVLAMADISHARIKDAFGPLYSSLTILLTVSVLSGDAANFAYANHDEAIYEKNYLLWQICAFIFLFYILLLRQPDPITACILSFFLICLPRYLVDLNSLLTICPIPRNVGCFRRLLSIQPFSGGLVLKSLMVFLLGIIAYLNWSLDIILVGLLGSPPEVNQLAITAGVFSIPSVALGFVVEKLQIRWIEKSGEFIIEDIKCILSSSLALILLLVPASAALLKVAGAQAVAVNQAGLIFGAALLSLLSNVGITIGTYMNSRLMFTRQVIVAGLVALPVNLFLSVQLYDSMGALGVILGTVAGQVVTIAGNLITIARSPQSSAPRIGAIKETEEINQ